MPEQISALDKSAIQRLRAIVKSLNAGARRGIPMAEVVSIPSNLPERMAMTVDYAATRELGHEMIVLRMPTFPAGSRVDARLTNLSRRELDVVALVAKGLSNKQIARKLHVTLATVKAHVHHILTKSDLPNRAAITAAYLCGAACSD